MEERCRNEIADLHAFFERWLAGETEDLSRCESVLADGFGMIGPGGRHIDRAMLLANLREAHGARAVGIRIENYTAREIGGGLCLATYEEWQDDEREVRGRLSTALFRARDDAPHGVEWLHVHETWLP